jgi:hypothetical protein
MNGPNRTYVEMMLDLADCGKIVLPNNLYKEAARIAYILYKNPELNEQVVQMRIKVYKEFNKYDGYHRLQDYQKFMIDYAIICKLINRPCYITMPYRSGKTIFYKILMNMWYGGMMVEEFGNTDRTGRAFSNEKEIDEAYQHYMEMNFGNISRNEFLQKRFTIQPMEREDSDETHNI